ncbi:hypothetical protein J3F84DRAFT_386617 [Trichoderma pleuroticola]
MSRHVFVFCCSCLGSIAFKGATWVITGQRYRFGGDCVCSVLGSGMCVVLDTNLPHRIYSVQYSIIKDGGQGSW